MNRRISLGLLVLSFILFARGVAVAQEASSSASPTAQPTATPEVFNYEKAYKDLVFQMDQYNKSHSDYLLARGQYFQAQTLASKTKARDATAVMLVNRDLVMKSYLTALRMRLSEGVGVDENTKAGIFGRIDADVLWWDNHKGRINSAGSLEDLVADSDEALKHYPVSEALSYEALSTVSLGKESLLRTTLNEILGMTKLKISEIRGNGDHNTTNAERWVIETEQKITRSLDKELEAQKAISTFAKTDATSRRSEKSETYNTVLLRLEESLQFIREASGYMREVVKSLKTKQ